MSAKDHPPPSRDELLAMAYVDGELDENARRDFELRLAAEAPLALEVAELRQLAVLARQVAPPEPMDSEWDRLEKEWLHTGGRSFSLLLTAAGVIGLFLWGVYAAATASFGLVPRVLLVALLVGLAGLFLVTLRARLRTLPYDPYTKVKR